MVIRFLFLLSLSIVFVVSDARLLADDETPAETESQQDIADVLIACVDVVFSQHVDPPTRGELLRRGIKGILNQAVVTRSHAVGRRISNSEPSEYAELLREMIGSAKLSGETDERLQAAFVSSLLDEKRVGAEMTTTRYVPEKEYRA